MPIYHIDLLNVQWKTLAQTINKILGDLKIVEDKFIGPWFIKDSDLIEGKLSRLLLEKFVHIYGMMFLNIRIRKKFLQSIVDMVSSPNVF